MIPGPFRYPLGDAGGRSILLETAGSIVLIALGLRYTDAFAPSLLAIVPTTAAGIGLVLFFGILSHVLVADDTIRSRRSVRTTVRSGIVTVVLAIGILAVPTAVLGTTVAGFAQIESPPDGATGFLLLAGSTIAIFTFVACAYAFPTAVATAVRTGRVRAAVDADAVVPSLRDTSYFLRWTVSFTLWTLAGGFTVVTIRSGNAVGLLAAFVAAYLSIAGAHIVDVGDARVAGSERVEEVGSR